MKAASSLFYVLEISVSPNRCPNTRVRVQAASLIKSGENISIYCYFLNYVDRANPLPMTEFPAFRPILANSCFAGIPKYEEPLDWNSCGRKAS